MSLEDWDLNSPTVTGNSVVKTSYVAIPNINSARECTRLQMVKLQSHSLVRKLDGGKDEDPKTVVCSTTLTVHGGK